MNIISVNPVYGPKGDPGDTPFIGENGNWWVGETDTGMPATNAFRFKGTKETIAELPPEGNIFGDVYNVLEDAKNYAWGESGWAEISDITDYSIFLTKDDANNDFATKEEVEQGLNLKANNGDLAVVAKSGSYTDLKDKPDIPAQYILPVATSTTLGGVKIGSGLTITDDGILSSSGGGTGGTSDYNALSNKPHINGVEVSGDKNAAQYGLQPAGEYITESQLDDKGFAKDTDVVHLNKDEDIPSMKSFLNGMSIGNVDGTQKTKVFYDVAKDTISIGDNGEKSLAKISDIADNIPIATTSTLGTVKPDGTTITITPEGIISAVSGSSGTSDYEALTNKPKINNVELTGNKTLSDIGAQPVGDYLVQSDLDNYALKSELPENTSDLTNDSGFITSSALSDYAQTSSLATVATSGSYNDLMDKPTIPEEYILPTASTSVLGGVKVDGSTITISDGVISSVNSSTGTTDYSALSNKPQINSVELSGNKSLTDLGIQAAGDYVTEEDLTLALSSKADSSELANYATTTSVQGKADKATTLSGYGITDAYTKAEIDGKLTGAFHYKGSKENYAALPSDGNVQGDVWNVEDTGANYAWTGAAWDKLSETIDLSSYLSKTEATDLYATKSSLSTVATSGNYSDLNGKPDIPDEYVLPTATADVLGGIKVGSGLSIADGVLSVSGMVIEELSGTNLQADHVYKKTLTAATSFTLPTISDNLSHSIIIYAQIGTGGSISDFGTTKYYNNETLLEGDAFDLIYIYNPVLNMWVYNIVKVS